MTEALTKLTPLDDSQEQTQFNAAVNIGLLGPVTLMDDQLRAERMDQQMGGGVLSVWAKLDPERRRQEINAWVEANSEIVEGDPLDGYYNEDGSILNISGLNMTGTMTIVAGRKAALRQILAGSNLFSGMSIAGATGLTRLSIAGGSEIASAIDIHTFTALTWLELSGKSVVGTAISGLSSLHALAEHLTLKDLNPSGAMNVSAASSLLAVSLTRCLGTTSLVLPNSVTSLTLQSTPGCTVPDTSGCSGLTTIIARLNGWAAADIDALLANAVATGLSGGSILTRYAFETEATPHVNAHPTAAGYADAATLTDRGWTVNV